MPQNRNTYGNLYKPRLLTSFVMSLHHLLEGKADRYRFVAIKFCYSSNGDVISRDTGTA